MSDHLISFVDPIGNTFLMPCNNPNHQAKGINVYENEFKHHILKRKTKKVEEGEIDENDHEDEH